MRRIIGIMCVVGILVFPVNVLAEPYQIPAEFWAAPRSGQAVLSLEPLREMVQRHLANPSSMLRLNHGPSEEAQANAGELRSWLIALGIDANHIVVATSPSPNQSISVELVESK